MCDIRRPVPAIPTCEKVPSSTASHHTKSRDAQVLSGCVAIEITIPETTLKVSLVALARRPVKVVAAVRTTARRGLATVQDPPVRHYGGLKDQDRIFTNCHSRHDHGIKGAMVSSPIHDTSLATAAGHTERWGKPMSGYRLAATGTEQKTSSSRATPGSSKTSRTRVFVDEVGLGSPAA